MIKLQNIHNLTIQPYELEENLDPNLERAQLLTNAATEAAHKNRARTTTNLMLRELSGADGKRFAESLIKHASLLEIPSYGANLSHKQIDKDLWIGVHRPKLQILGGVMVQRDVSVINSDKEPILMNGTCVEAWSLTSGTNHLSEMIKSGVEVAEEIADGQEIFSIEPVEITQSRINRLVNGVIKIDQNVLEALGKVYAFSENTGLYQRTDMPHQSPVKATIYSNGKVS